MIGGNHGEVKFLVSTQEDHNTPDHRWKQISSARSYLATRSHAQRRGKNAAIISAEDEERSNGQSVIARRRSTDGALAKSRFLRIAPRPASTNKVSKEPDEEEEHDSEIPLQYLVDIFQPLATGGEDRSQKSNHIAATTEIAPLSLSPHTETTVNEESTSCSQIASNKPQRVVSTSPHPPSRPSPLITTTADHEDAPNSHSAFMQAQFFNTALSVEIFPESASTLYPFVHLPVEVTTYERSLINFYLVSGRSWLLGTSETARFCPAIALSRLLMQIDPIYVLAHIIIGELLLSKATKRPLRKSYYKRCAEIYKATNVLLLDEEVSTHKKMWTLIQLAMLEATARRSDLQALHIKALDEFAESRGGITAVFENNQADCFSFVTSRLYAGPLVWAPIPILFLRRLEVVKARFLKSLDEIQTWSSAFRTWVDSPSSTAVRDQIVSHRRLDTITAYLHTLVSKWRSAEVMSMSLETKSGALFCGLSLARTFVECECSPAAAFNFLYEAQEALRCSTTPSYRPGHELDNLHPAASAFAISCTRSKLFSDHDDPSREARISETLSDAHKLFILLTVARRIEIVEWVAECIATVGVLASEFEGLMYKKQSSIILDSQHLQTLGEEIDRAWRAANVVEEG